MIQMAGIREMRFPANGVIIPCSGGPEACRLSGAKSLRANVIGISSVQLLGLNSGNSLYFSLLAGN